MHFDIICFKVFFYRTEQKSCFFRRFIKACCEDLNTSSSICYVSNSSKSRGYNDIPIELYMLQLCITKNIGKHNLAFREKILNTAGFYFATLYTIKKILRQFQTGSFELILEQAFEKYLPL